MQIIIEIHPAFDAEANLLIEGICNDLAGRDDKVANHIATEVRAQLLAGDECHYFASSFANWVADADLIRAIERCKALDTRSDKSYIASGCTVYRVPGPVERPYHIDRYVPDVPGVSTVAQITYKPNKSKKSSVRAVK